MTPQKSKELLFFKIPVFVIDLLIHVGVLQLLLGMKNYAIELSFITQSGQLERGVYFLLLLSFLISIFFFDLKIHDRHISPQSILWRAFKQTFVTYVLFVTSVTMIYEMVPRDFYVTGFILSFPCIMVFHFIANYVVRLIRKYGRNKKNIVFVGADVTAQRVYNELNLGRAYTGYNILGFFTSYDELDLPEGAKRLGEVGDFFEWIKDNDHGVQELYCSIPPATCQETVYKVIRACNAHLIDFYFVPTFDGYPKRHLEVSRVGNVNIIKLRKEPMNDPLLKAIKRLLDILISSVFLCTAYPFVVLFVLVGNYFGGNRGPLYFRQARTGYNGKTFRIYKFRSMRDNADADKLQATKNDPRKTPFGDFLRRSSIDELPQFINVFLGDMSIIGPRPHMEYHTDVYSSLIGDYMVRHLAKPGITGWAQVSGCRGETQTVEQMKDRVEHDIWYIEHWSLLLDLEIFFKTIWQVIGCRDKQAY